MEISGEELEEFRKIYLAETGVEITDEDALKKARRLLVLIKFALEAPP